MDVAEAHQMLMKELSSSMFILPPNMKDGGLLRVYPDGLIEHNDGDVTTHCKLTLEVTEVVKHDTASKMNKELMDRYVKEHRSK